MSTVPKIEIGSNVLEQLNSEELRKLVAISSQILESRLELLRKDGLLTPEVFGVRTKLGPITCVDGIPVRINKKTREVEVAGIVRGTGPYTGRIAHVGGIIGMNETLDAAGKRHIETDLGVGAEVINTNNLTKTTSPYVQPWRVVQYERREKDSVSERGFGDANDPTKHAIALTFLIKLGKGKFKFGSNIDGQEAKDVVWFSEKTLPPAEKFAYGTRDTFVDALKDSRDLLKKEIPATSFLRSLFSRSNSK